MKNNWPINKICDVATLMTGGTPSKVHPEYFGGNIKWLVSGDIHQKEIYDCNGRITEEGLKNSNARLLPVNSVLIALNGQGKTRGTVALLRISASCNQSLVAIVPQVDIVMPEFLYHSLNGRYLEIRNITGMDKRQGLNMRIIGDLEIPLPPLETQKKIVAKIEELFLKIDEVKKLCVESQKEIANLFPAALHKIFEEGKKKGWEEKKIGDFLNFCYGKGLSRDERSNLGEYFVYGANGPLGKSNKFLVEGEGIIVGRKGSAGEIKRVSGRYWPTDVTYYILEKEMYDINFIYYMLEYLNLPQYAVGVKPGINRNQIYGLRTFLPPLSEQKKIVEYLDSLSEKTKKIQELQEQTAEELKELEQSILHKAFNGELMNE